MIPDVHITEARLKAVRELPWPIPALVVVGMLGVRRMESRAATVDRPNEGRTA